jgi:uncharacterized membrane protein
MRQLKYDSDPTLWVARVLVAIAAVFLLGGVAALIVGSWLAQEALDAETAARVTCAEAQEATGSLVGCNSVLASCTAILAGHGRYTDEEVK